MKTVLGVLQHAFQMAANDDLIVKNLNRFQLTVVVVNDSVTRKAINCEKLLKS